MAQASGSMVKGLSRKTSLSVPCMAIKTALNLDIYLANCRMKLFQGDTLQQMICAESDFFLLYNFCGYA